MDRHRAVSSWLVSKSAGKDAHPTAIRNLSWLVTDASSVTISFNVTDKVSVTNRRYPPYELANSYAFFTGT